MELFNLFRKKRKEKLFEPQKKKKEKNFGEKQKAKTEARKEDRILDVTERNAKSLKEKIGLSSNGVIKPHITEKSTFLNEKGVYVFKIKPNVNKIMVKNAIKIGYGVNPAKVRIVNAPPKQIFVKRRRAVKPGFKKAVVYLKTGEKITI